MLSPTSPSTPLIAGAVLIILLLWLMLRAMRKDKREYGRFKRYRSTVKRQQVYRKWVTQSFLAFGGSSALVIALVWQHIPRFFEAFFALPAVAGISSVLTSHGSLVRGIIIGVLALLVVGSVVALLLVRHNAEVPTIGDIAALLPRNRAELKYGAVLSLNAGIVEELLFRLALPVLIFVATGSAAFAIAAGISLFGLLHLYQGVAGVIGSMVIGALLMALFLATESILLVIVVHALIDLRSLVLIPVVVYRVHKITSGTPRTPSPAAK